MSNVMRCPRCGSSDVECHPKVRGRPHMHECHACGYDGTSADVPLWAHLDVWLALGGTPADFDTWMADPKRTPADAWAQLLAAIRGDDMPGDHNPEPGLILDLVKEPS